MFRVSQYPRNVDSTPLDLEVGVLTDELGNNGARLPSLPKGPDDAPIDAKGLVLVDKEGNFVPPPVVGAAYSIGLFTEGAVTPIPAIVNVVRTVGYSLAGRGDANYIYDAAVDAAYVAANPRTSFLSFNSRGFRLNEKTVTPLMLGAVGDGVADDHAALQPWLDIGGDLFLPDLQFFSSLGLIVRKQVHVHGVGYGFDAREASYAAMPGSRIRFANDVTVSRLFDIQPQSPITDIATALAAIAGGTYATQEGSAGSTFRDFALIGPNVGAVDGFYTRSVIHAENVSAVQFGGRGFTIMATADIPNAGDEYGNASTVSLKNCVALDNGSHGLHVRGRDANTCVFENFNAHQNGGWGILEESLLGNKHAKPHIAGNTLGAIKSIGTVNGSIWVNPYIEGDVFSNCEIGGTNTVLGGDLTANNTPPDAPPSQYGQTLTTIRRLKFVWNAELDFAYPIANTALVYRDGNLGLVLSGQGAAADLCFKNKNGDTVANVGTGGVAWSFKGDASMDGVNPIFAMRGTGGVGTQFIMASDGIDRLQVYTATGGIVYVSANSLTFRNKTTLVAHTTFDGSGNWTLNGTLAASNFSGSFSGSHTGASSGTNTGDQFTNTTAGVLIGRAGGGGPGAAQEITLAGGITLVAGALSLGNITPTGVASTGNVVSSHATAGIGYAAGAGGAVVQATSKATGVALNTVAGQITTHNASLAANTAVSFTFTNSAITAHDEIMVWIKSGTAGGGTYLVQVDQVAAGSCRVSIRNLTAGALAETMVLGFAVRKAVIA